MHSSRMRTTRLLTVSCSAGWGVCTTLLYADIPGSRSPRMQTPWIQTPLGCRPPSCMQTPPDAGSPGCTPPWMQTPPLDADPPDADPSQMQDVGYTFVNTICLQLFMNEMLIPFLLWSSDKSIYLRKIFDCHWFKNQFTCCRT